MLPPLRCALLALVVISSGASAEELPLSVAPAWARLDLPFSSGRPLTAAVFRDTLFVGGGAVAGQAILCAVPLAPDAGAPRVIPCRVPPELRLSGISELVGMGDSLVALCEIDAGGSGPTRGLFVYDGRWRRFPAMPEESANTSYLIHDLQIHTRLLCIAGSFRMAGRRPRESVVAWDGHTWQALGLRLDLTYRGELAEHGCELVGVFCKSETELDELWLQRRFSQQLIVSWEGWRWRNLFTGRGGHLGSPVVHRGDLCLGQTTLQRYGPGTAEVVRLVDGDLIRLGEEFGLSRMPDWEHRLRLAVYRGYLVAAGTFDRVGGDAIGRAAFWDGDSWRALGALAQDIWPDILFTAGQRLWCGGTCADPGCKDQPARLYYWDGLPPLGAPPVPYAPPEIAAAVPAAPPDTLQPFRNGDFTQWRDGAPEGWLLWKNSHGPSGAYAAYTLTATPGGGVVIRPDPNCEGKTTISQHFRCEPGRYYRLRVRSRHTPRADADPSAGAARCRIHFSIGGAWDNFELTTPGPGVSESTLLASEATKSGDVAITCHRSTDMLEILDIAVEEVPLGFGDCFDLLATEIDAHYAFPDLPRDDWNGIVAELRPAAARAINSDAFRNILNAALNSLRDPEIRVVSGNVIASFITEEMQQSYTPPKGRGSTPQEGERLLRLPCNVRVIFRER